VPKTVQTKNWTGTAQADGRYYSDPSKYGVGGLHSVWAFTSMRVEREATPKARGASTSVMLAPGLTPSASSAWINDAGQDTVYLKLARNETGRVYLNLESLVGVSGLSVELDTLTRSGGSETITSPARGVVTGNNVFRSYDAAWAPRSRRDIKLYVANYAQFRAASTYGNGNIDFYNSGGGNWDEKGGPSYIRRPHNASGVANAGTLFVDRPLAFKYVPDILIPHEVVNYGTANEGRFDIGVGRSQLVMLSVHVRTGLTPGTYRGTITIKKAGAALTTVPVRVDVGTLTLPTANQAWTWANGESWQFGVARYIDWNNSITAHAAFVAEQRKLYRQMAHDFGVDVLFTDQTYAVNTETNEFLNGTEMTNARGYAGQDEGVGARLHVLGIFGAFGYGAFTDDSEGRQDGYNWRAIRDITPGNPTTIRTWGDHGKSTGFQWKVRNCPAPYTTLNNTLYSITVTGADTFTIPANTTGFAAYTPWATGQPVRGYLGPILSQTWLDGLSTAYTNANTQAPSILKMLYLIDEPGYDMYFYMQYLIDRVKADTGSIKDCPIFIAGNCAHLKDGAAANGNFGVRGFQYHAGGDATANAWWLANGGVKGLPYNQPPGARTNGESEAAALRVTPWSYVKGDRPGFYIYHGHNHFPTDLLNFPDAGFANYVTMYYKERNAEPGMGTTFDNYLTLANQNPISDGGKWTNVVLPGRSGTGLQIVSNQARVRVNGEWNIAYRNDAVWSNTYCRNQRATAAAGGLTTSRKGAIFLRCSGNGATFNAYGVEYASNGVQLVKYVNGVRSTIGAFVAYTMPSPAFIQLHVFDYVEAYPGTRPFLLATVNKEWVASGYDTTGSADITSGVPGCGLLADDGTTYLDTNTTAFPGPFYVNGPELRQSTLFAEKYHSPEESGAGVDLFTTMRNWGDKPFRINDAGRKLVMGPDYGTHFTGRGAYNGGTNYDGVLFVHSWHRMWPTSGVPGIDGPFPTLRLAFLADGMNDMKYHALAKAVNASAANAILDEVLPGGALENATRDANGEWRWPLNTDTFEAKRQALRTLAGG
jgi:hypothetical protein